MKILKGGVLVFGGWLGFLGTVIGVELQQPLAVTGVHHLSGGAFTLLWEPVVRRMDGTWTEDVAGYNIYRRSAPRGTPERINSFLVPLTVFADRSEGRVYYYSIRAVDKQGQESEESMLVASDPEASIYYMSPDGVSTVRIPGAAAEIFHSRRNTTGVSLMLVTQEGPLSDTGGLIRSVSFKLVRSDTMQPVPGQIFTGAYVNVNVGFRRVNGQIARGTPSLSAAENLCLYWNNGVSWIRLGGVLNEQDSVVAIQSSNLGDYQLRVEPRAPGLALNQANVYPRIFTPNQDGANDSVRFVLENPQNDSVTGKIFDLAGRLVATLSTPTPGGGTSATFHWNGTDSVGSVVPSGEYLYRIMGPGRTFTGVVSVVR